jgi:glycosyltransferase involved in cell wall biosynthesis
MIDEITFRQESDKPSSPSSKPSSAPKKQAASRPTRRTASSTSSSKTAPPSLSSPPTPRCARSGSPRSPPPTSWSGMKPHTPSPSPRQAKTSAPSPNACCASNSTTPASPSPSPSKRLPETNAHDASSIRRHRHLQRRREPGTHPRQRRLGRPNPRRRLRLHRSHRGDRPQLQRHRHRTPWPGFAAQKNFAIAQCTGDWILSLDADEELSPELQQEIRHPAPPTPPLTPSTSSAATSSSAAGSSTAASTPTPSCASSAAIRQLPTPPSSKTVPSTRPSPSTAPPPRSTPTSPPRLPHALVLHRAHGPLQLARRPDARRAMAAPAANLPSPSSRASSLPVDGFKWNYIFRLGFLDGREGLLLHLYHATYTSWKYAKAWEKQLRCIGRRTLRRLHADGTKDARHIHNPRRVRLL